MINFLIWIGISFYNLGVFIVVLLILLIAVSSLVTLICSAVADAIIKVEAAQKR